MLMAMPMLVGKSRWQRNSAESGASLQQRCTMGSCSGDLLIIWRMLWLKDCKMMGNRLSWQCSLLLSPYLCRHCTSLFTMTASRGSCSLYSWWPFNQIRKPAVLSLMWRSLRNRISSMASAKVGMVICSLRSCGRFGDFWFILNRLSSSQVKSLTHQSSRSSCLWASSTKVLFLSANSSISATLVSSLRYLSWKMTISSSLVRRMSNSTQWQRWTAASMLSRVFSGKRLQWPRWAMTKGLYSLAELIGFQFNLNNHLQQVSKFAHPAHPLPRRHHQPVLRLHRRDFTSAHVLHQKLTHVLLQQMLDQLLQPRILPANAEHLFQALLYLALCLQNLLIHFVQVRIVRHLLALADPRLLLSPLVERHDAVALPQSFNLPEHAVHPLQLLLKPASPHVLHSLMPRLVSPSLCANLGLHSFPVGKPIARWVLVKKQRVVVSEQLLVDWRCSFPVEICGYFGQFGLRLNGSGCRAVLCSAQFHQQIYILIRYRNMNIKIK